MRYRGSGPDADNAFTEDKKQPCACRDEQKVAEKCTLQRLDQLKLVGCSDPQAEVREEKAQRRPGEARDKMGELYAEPEGRLCGCPEGYGQHDTIQLTEDYPAKCLKPGEEPFVKK